MPYNQSLFERIRTALAHLPSVAEKKMFGKMAFMVDGKMCLTVGADRIMCRIDPASHDELIRIKGVQTVVMGRKEYRGFIYVTENVIQTEEELRYWISLALAYNKQAPARKQKSKLK